MIVQIRASLVQVLVQVKFSISFLQVGVLQVRVLQVQFSPQNTVCQHLQPPTAICVQERS